MKDENVVQMKNGSVCHWRNTQSYEENEGGEVESGLFHIERDEEEETMSSARSNNKSAIVAQL